MLSVKSKMYARVIFLLWFLLFPAQVFSRSGQYDLAYLWDQSLDNVLDYQNQLEEILPPDVSRNLCVVRSQQGDFGLIYDHNGTALSSAQLMVQHSEMLKNAGLVDCFAVEDQGYYQLYNVSYGLGPNLESLKKKYRQVYHYLGSEVGKNLFIEQTAGDNYTLIYRRRGDRSSTYRVAKKHAGLLKGKGISTTIIAEKNNPVVFGETSHLVDTESVAVINIPAKKKPEKNVALSTSDSTKDTAPPVIIQASSAPGRKEVEQAIESFIKELRREGKISSDERTGWMVYDLTRRESLAEINGCLLYTSPSPRD